MSLEPKVSSRELRRELQRQATALQRLGDAASRDFDWMGDAIKQTREFLADLSARVDAQVEVAAEQLQRETAPLRRDLWGRLRWLVTGR